MLRCILLSTAAALAGCRAYVERSYPDAAGGATAGAALGSSSGGGPGALAGATVGAGMDKHPPVTAVVRVRPRALLTKVALGPKGKAAPLYKGWAEGMGVPLDAVEELTIVCTAAGPQSVRVVTAYDVDPTPVKQACDGLLVTMEGKRTFVCSPSPFPPLDARVRKQLESAGTHDVVVWADASLLGDLDGVAAGMKDGFRDGTVAVDVGDEAEVSARMNFKDEAAAVKGAKLANALVKMGRMFLLQMTAQLDLVEAFPGMVDGSTREEMAMIKAYFGLLRNAEPALLGCKAVPRGTMVPLYVRAEVPATKLGDLVPMMEYKSVAGDKKPTPGLFFGTKVKGETKEVARPMPLPTLPPTPVAPVATVQATPVGPAGLLPAGAAQAGWAHPGAPPPAPMMPPAPTMPPPAGPYPAPVSPVAWANPVAPVGPLPPPPVTPLPPPALPPRPARSLTVANVHREDVSVFVVEASGLRFLKTVPAGEAVDVPILPGQRMAATFRRAPHCANFTVTGSAGEVWLLRPAPGVSPTSTSVPAACAPVNTAR